ncbi:bifunctional oligoribonuclease/PAP phosphatase NrnA [candidate division KSB1 bacterium]
MKDNSSEIARIIQIINEKTRFVLTTHINPDGDGLGSEIALYYLLKSQNKEVHIINASPMSRIYTFFDPENEKIETYAGRHKEIILNADVIFVLDISVLHRLGIVGDIVARNKGLHICVDHHSTNSFKADVMLIDEKASATGELVFDIFKQGKYEIDKNTAEALYVAIMTDTGCFRFSNTSARAHSIGSELLQTGVEHRVVYGYIYERNTWGKALLFAKTYGGIQRASGGKIAWMKITQEMLKETGSTLEDIEGFVEYPRNIEDVMVSILFVERTEFDIKLSFRSSNKVSVDKLAAEFGGGGHRNAAAAILHGTTMNKAVETTLSTTEKYLS